MSWHHTPSIAHTHIPSSAHAHCTKITTSTTRTIVEHLFKGLDVVDGPWGQVLVEEHCVLEGRFHAAEERHRRRLCVTSLRLGLWKRYNTKQENPHVVHEVTFQDERSTSNAKAPSNVDCMLSRRRARRRHSADNQTRTPFSAPSHTWFKHLLGHFASFPGRDVRVETSRFLEGGLQAARRSTTHCNTDVLLGTSLRDVRSMDVAACALPGDFMRIPRRQVLRVKRQSTVQCLAATTGQHSTLEWHCGWELTWLNALHLENVMVRLCHAHPHPKHEHHQHHKRVVRQHCGFRAQSIAAQAQYRCRRRVETCDVAVVL